MALPTHMTCHKCGESFPVGLAHTTSHCDAELARKAAEVERTWREREAQETPPPPYPPLETI